MVDYNKAFRCGCCVELYPTLHKHTHHKTPKALGGKDTPDNLIDLCPQCHDALHNVAYKLLTNIHGQAKVIDSLTMIYKDNAKAKENCLELAIQVRNAMVLQKEKGLAPNDLVNISTTLRKQHKTLMEARVRELKKSQESYLRGLVLADLAGRFKDIPISSAEEDRLINDSRAKVEQQEIQDDRKIP